MKRERKFLSEPQVVFCLRLTVQDTVKPEIKTLQY